MIMSAISSLSVHFGPMAFRPSRAPTMLPQIAPVEPLSPLWFTAATMASSKLPASCQMTIRRTMKSPSGALSRSIT